MNSLMKLMSFLHNVEDCVIRMWSVIKIMSSEMWNSLWRCITNLSKIIDLSLRMMNMSWSFIFLNHCMRLILFALESKEKKFLLKNFLEEISIYTSNCMRIYTDLVISVSVNFISLCILNQLFSLFSESSCRSSVIRSLS